MDKAMFNDYEVLRNKVNIYLPNNLLVHYLYTRSYYPERPLKKEYQEAFDYWIDTFYNHRHLLTLKSEAMLAIALNRYGMEDKAQIILKSLEERAIIDPQGGAWWKANTNSYYWYQNNISTQARLITAFTEAGYDAEFTEAMKLWLLNRKRVEDWGNQRATAEACYVFLQDQPFGKSENDGKVELFVNNKAVDEHQYVNAFSLPGMGYYKYMWYGQNIESGMGNIRFKNHKENTVWASVYWQYHEQLDRVTAPAQALPLNIRKSVYKKQMTESGPVLSPLKTGEKLKPGDVLLMRIHISSKQNMDYIHIQDMRAAGLEPVETVSRYHYHYGLGYYMSIHDDASNFFIRRLPAGSHTIEYELIVSQTGNFHNGISSIQSFYAPEFVSHTKGERIGGAD